VQNKVRSANQGKRYVSRLGELFLCTNMVIQVPETVTKEKERKREKQPNFSLVWHTGLSGGAPDSVRCTRLISSEKATLGFRRRRMTIIHRTVRWCTGLPGESSAMNSSSSGKAKGQRGYNSPDCPLVQRTIR
jgi:hypothetical protein